MQLVRFVSVNFIDGEVLHITRVSRLHMGAYLCIASNGVPPSISKRVTLKVQCEYLVTKKTRPKWSPFYQYHFTIRQPLRIKRKGKHYSKSNRCFWIRTENHKLRACARVCVCNHNYNLLCVFVTVLKRIPIWNL